MKHLPLVLGLIACAAPFHTRAAQDDGIERPGPPAIERFETDENRDGVPDGWYNLRDARMMPEGGVVGPGMVRFENDRPGRQARISRAFGVDGSKSQAILISLWIRLEKAQPGERLGDDPGLAIDFLGPELRTLGRGTMGPWTRTIGRRWTKVSKRFPVPPETKDAILSVGLHGATGVMDLDGMSFELVPAGENTTTNVLLNGDFELGDPDPFGWAVEHGARRGFPGYRSSSALELTGSGARAMNGLGIPVESVGSIEVTMMVRAAGLRGSGGAESAVFFLDGDGRVLKLAISEVPRPSGSVQLFFPWSGSFEWRQERNIVPVPPGAVRAVIQVDKTDAIGSLFIDDVRVTASPNGSNIEWSPYHVATNVDGWLPVSPAPEIAAGSALDFSFLLHKPAGSDGFLTVKDGRFAFERSGRARFFGVTMIAPSAFQDPEKTDALAARLARAGVNLVRLGDLDTPLGPGRSLLDDTRDDTQALDPLALQRLDHFIAALKSRGIQIAIELQAARRFRSGDEVPGYRGLPAGGGPAAGFDPRIRELALKTAEQLLTHVNPETGLALRDDPVLACFTLVGELTLFDLIEHPDLLPVESAEELKKLAREHPAGSMRKFWLATESAQWRSLAEGLRDLKLRVPIAGCSHYRRGPAEFATVQTAQGLDFIDDRLYFSPPVWGLPDRRTLLRSASGGIVAAAAPKRHKDRPYLVGQWADYTDGAWALPYEAGDLMLAAAATTDEDWDGLVRRGVFLYPETWGANATGSAGGDDFFQIPESVNGIPQVFALLPHAASVVLRGQDRSPRSRSQRSAVNRRSNVSGWEPLTGRLLIDTPFTQGLAGWPEGKPATFDTLTIDVDNPYAVVVASSVGTEPIATAKRLLVSAVARVEPTDFRWVDEWKKDVAFGGRPPLLQEPVRARVAWRKSGTVKAYALDNTGARLGPATTEKVNGGVRLVIDGRVPSLHWELVAE